MNSTSEKNNKNIEERVYTVPKYHVPPQEKGTSAFLKGHDNEFFNRFSFITNRLLPSYSVFEYFSD